MPFLVQESNFIWAFFFCSCFAFVSEVGGVLLEFKRVILRLF